MTGARDWRSIPADDYDWRVTGAPERPWMHDYTRTMTLKMYLAEPDGTGGCRVYLDIENAARIMRTMDRISLGVPKIIYLVGWQYNGHDDRYPAWHEANPWIKRPADPTPLQSILWLMEEGRRYHTTVSVHINMYDAYQNSPLWDTYVSNGLLNIAADGSPEKAGVWNGLQAYSVNYKREWDSGFAKKRIDELLSMLPLERAGTVHIDAFHCHPDPGRGGGWEDSLAGRRQIIRYWRDRGIDVTSEFLYNEPIFSYERQGPDQLLGLQPLAWHFSQLVSDYVDRPAGLICGGDAGHRGKAGGEKLGAVFGENVLGEPLWADWKNKRAVTGWEASFLREFCLKHLPFRFLNGLSRLSATCRPGEITAQFSGNVETSSRGPAITMDGQRMRDGGDVILPADWVSPRTLVSYSTSGGERTWALPASMKASTAVVEELGVGGPGANVDRAGSTRDVKDGRLTLHYRPGQAFVVTLGG
jgi:hypothetical protein